MKILEIVADGRPGGGTTVVLSLLQNLTAQTPWSLAFCGETASYAVARARELGIPTTEIDLFRGRLNPRYVFQLRRLIGRISPDLVHAHGARAALPLTLALGRRRTPLLYTVHGYQFTQKNPPLRYFGAAAERFISARANRTVFVCAHDRDLARRRHLSRPGNDQIIHNGIDADELPTAEPDDGRVVAFLGRLDHPKNPQLVIEVASLLRQEGFKFWLIGGGELEPELRAMVAERRLADQVLFFGALSREAALRQAAQAAMLIMPSRWEGLPLAPLEAMAMGLPVVAANVGGIPEIITDGETGFLIDRPDPAAYADRLRLLANDDTLRRRIQDAGRKHVLESFSRATMTSEYIALYRRLMSERGEDRA